MSIASDKPYGCLNCKTRLKGDEEFCPNRRCGDRVSRRPTVPPRPRA